MLRENIYNLVENVLSDNKEKDDVSLAAYLKVVLDNYYSTATEKVTRTFERELSDLLNTFSKENGSNTPDFILAEYLVNCLDAFNRATHSRAKWFGKSLDEIGNEKTAINNVLSSLEISEIGDMHERS